MEKPNQDEENLDVVQAKELTLEEELNEFRQEVEEEERESKELLN